MLALKKMVIQALRITFQKKLQKQIQEQDDIDDTIVWDASMIILEKLHNALANEENNSK